MAHLKPIRDKNSEIVISILIIHFKTPEMTEECLASIAEYPPAAPFEVILIDNRSDDDIEERARGIFPNIRFIEAGVNMGFSAANNLGIHNASGKYILLLNSDAKLVERLLDAMLDHMDRRPRLGVLGPREIDGEGNFQLSCGKFPTFSSEIARKIMHHRLSIKDVRIRDYLDKEHASLESTDWVSGSCMMIRKKALLDSRLFDERFFMYFEDIDLCARMLQRGWDVQFFPHGSILHHGGQSARINLMRSLVEYRKSQIYFTKKYYGIAGSVAIRFLLLIKYLAYALYLFPLYLMDRITGKGRRDSYTTLLLSKKVITLCFRSVPAHPQCPDLRKIIKS